MRALALLCIAACGGSSTVEPDPGVVTIVVTSPSPGAELAAADSPTIAVTGIVSTTAGVPEAWINGQRVAVAPDGSFTAQLPPAVGVNHVKVEGGDGVGALVLGAEMDVMWAPEYLAPIAGTTGFDLDGALDLELGQRFFDERTFGTTLDLTTDPVVAGDLGQALELILWHVDLAGLLGGRIQVGSGSSAIDIAIPSAAPGSIVVDAPERAIQLDISLLGVFVAMDGTFQFGNRTLLIDGGIAADMHASAKLTLATAEDGTIQVGAANVTASVGPLVPSFTGPDGDELDAFITLGGNDFRVLVEQLIADQLIPTFTEKVPPLLESLLGATGSVLDDVMFELDPGLGTAVMVQLDGTVGELDVVPGAAIGNAPGHVTVRQSLAIRTSAATPVHAASRGAPRVDPDSTAPASTSDLRLALRLDFLNALLHSMWNAGLLEGQATFGGLAASVSAKLAPVIRATPLELPCTIEGERCDVVVQLGQIEVALPDFAQSFGVNATAGARIVVDGDTVSIVIQDVPSLIVWETSAVPGTLQPDAVEDIIASVVWPKLFGAIGDNLTVTLPLPDLAELGLTDLAPGLANAKLELVVKHRPTLGGGAINLDGDLQLATPPPP